MKKIIFLLVLILTNNSLICQNPTPCGQYLDCSNDKTAHRYCTENGIQTKCVQNPYTTEWGHPLRIPEGSMPICLNFINSGPESVYGTWGCESCHDLVVAYLKSDFESDMNWSLDDWLCLCGLEDDACQCEIDIEFSDIADNFENPSISTSNNTLDMNPKNIVNNNCEIDCSKLKIYLNYTEEFCGIKDASDDFDHFFVSSNSEGYNDGIFNYVNLKSVILYQLAHIFGFGFIESHSSTCFDPFGIMNSYVKDARDDGKSGSSHNLTQKDKCTFMKLYCPELAATLVEDELQEKQIEASIFYDKVNFTFQTGNFSEKVNIELYNLLGKQVMVLQEYNLEAGEHTISINSENLNPGIYFVTIKSENNSQNKKIVIIK